jgi:hypothetical protein
MDVFSALLRDIDHVRYTLFTLLMPFSLSRANHKLFWPFIDNVYSIRMLCSVNSRKRDLRPIHQYNHVICRFKRARATLLASQGARASSTKRAIIGCGVSFALLCFLDHYEYWLVRRPRDQVTCIQHSHLLDESDANKRNSFLRTLVGAEVAKEYYPVAIIGSLSGEG